MKRLFAFCMIFWMSLLPALPQDKRADSEPVLELVRKGIDLMYDLDHAGAQKIFDLLKKDYPESPVGYGMTAINAFNQVLFASRNLAIYEYGIPAPVGRSVPLALMDTPEQKHFDDANGALQEFCEKILKENPEDALALYFNGLSYENLSILSMTHDRKMMRTKGYAKKAADIHKKVLEMDSSLIDAKASSAVLEYVIGSLNFILRVGARLFGLKGDKKGAIEKLLEVGEKGTYRSTDAKVALAYLQAWKGDPRVAVSILGDLRKKHPRSFLYDVGLATAYMDAAKDAKSAIQVYEELLDNISSKAPGVYPGEIHFRIANCYVQLRDYSLAIEQFQKALDKERGDAETEPLANYNMALIYEERGEKELAKDHYRRAANYTGPTVLIEKEIERARKKIR